MLQKCCSSSYANFFFDLLSDCLDTSEMRFITENLSQLCSLHPLVIQVQLFIACSNAFTSSTLAMPSQAVRAFHSFFRSFFLSFSFFICFLNIFFFFLYEGMVYSIEFVRGGCSRFNCFISGGVKQCHENPESNQRQCYNSDARKVAQDLQSTLLQC
jgi:hypothetical protein